MIDGDKSIRFGILGDLRVTVHGVSVPIGPPKQRATLGLLLLRANSVVPTTELLTTLWGPDAPRTSRKMLQNAISELRIILEVDTGPVPAAALLTHTSGYLLRVRPDALDLLMFRWLAEQGRRELAAGATPCAVRTLRSGLSLWRGPVLADVAGPSFVATERRALHDERLSVLEDLKAAELGTDVAEPELPVTNVRSVQGKRRQVTAMLVAWDERGWTVGDIEEICREQAERTAIVHGEVERYGGVVVTSIGSMTLALFGSADAPRAVTSAATIRRRLGTAVRIAVACGEVTVHGDPPVATGEVLDRCSLMLEHTAPGATKLCDVTRNACE